MDHPIAFLEQRLGNMKELGGYGLIANLGRLDPPEHKIADGLVLRRATPIETEEMRRLLGYYDLESTRNPWESRVTQIPNANGFTAESAPLAEPEFRYHVVEFKGTNGRYHHLIEASLFTAYEFERGIEVHYGPNNFLGTTFNPTIRRFEYDAAVTDDVFVSLGPDEVADLAHVSEKLLTHDHSIVDLATAVRDYLAVREIPKRLPIRIVAHFAILESLVSHNPDPKDPSDSVGRQVRKKMALLNRRFKPRAINYADYFPTSGADSDTIWKKLYEVRSALAHGSRPEFTAKLQILGSLDKVDRFIQAATSRVMRQALEEPELLADLKDC